ncbi:hypothetical protein FocTR4_00002311, partial [Fusarium oxysporum f. sp. cubense]
KPLLIRNTKQQYKGSYKLSITHIIKKLKEAKIADFSLVPKPNKGRPRLLSDSKEEAIICFII